MRTGRRKGAALLLAGLLCLAAAGCSKKEGAGEKVRDLEFTVIGEAQIPLELKELIGQKGTGPFKLTYSDDQNLYIAVGYGEQSTGGCSICVNQLYLSENSIVIDTELKGPEKGENPGPGPVSPYIVVQTEYLEEPVVFQ